jgi:uncharacterized membrane protein YkoI
MYTRVAPGFRRATDSTEKAVPDVLPPALLIAMVLTAPSLGAAQSHTSWLLAQATSTEAQQSKIDRQEAARRAADATGGKVLAAEPDTVDGKPVYRVKVLTPDGHVRTIVIETGERSGAR